jgi:hypothetical protein
VKQAVDSSFKSFEVQVPQAAAPDAADHAAYASYWPVSIRRAAGLVCQSFDQPLLLCFYQVGYGVY